jgi:cation diffusion facilitator family transporter
VVLTILASAIVAGAFAVEKLITRQPPTHLLALAVAGVVGMAGNAIAAQIRSSTGRRLNSPALIADGAHARSDALVSAGVVLSAAMVWAGLAIADPIIGLVITAMILRITWESWHIVRGDAAHEH